MSEDRNRNNRATIIIIAALIILAIVLISCSGTRPDAQVNIPTPPASTSNPTAAPTLQAAIQPPIGLTILPTPADEANWAVSFQYRFPDGYWKNGGHQYTLKMLCPLAQDPKDKDREWTNSFEVSSAAPIIPGDVYLRPEGAGSAVLFRQPINAISDSQSTVALVSLTGLTYNQAGWYPRNCTVTIQTDNGIVQPLQGGAPYQP